MPKLSGRTVLVLEDEPLICLDLVTLLIDAGAKTLDASRFSDAIRLAESPDLSAAILDINLGGENCSPVCRRLWDRGIPFVFHTGYSDSPVLSEWPMIPVVSKPATIDGIVDALLMHLPADQNV